MNTMILLGPFRHDTGYPPENSGILMEFTPFRKNCITETDARSIAEDCAAGTPRFGRFEAPSLNQLLYFFSEDIINGAVITEMEERSLSRLSETVSKPLFLTANTDREERLAQRERLPVSGLYFPHAPSLVTVEKRVKPYIFAFSEKEEKRDITALLRTNPPFALHCVTEKEARKAGEWLREITKEMR